MKKKFCLFFFLPCLFFSQNLINVSLLEINYGGDSEPDHIVKVGEKIYFSTLSDNSLWVKNSIGEKAIRIKNFSDGNQYIKKESIFKVLNGIVFFTIYKNNGIELWRSDGTEVGTFSIKKSDFYASNISELVVFNNKIYFAFYDGTSSELWFTDGTESGTNILKKINSTGNSNVKNLFIFKDKFFFTANDGIHGNELWECDGTNDGTNLFIDIETGINSGVDSLPIVTDKYFFFAAVKNNVKSLWVSDGKSQNTKYVKSYGLTFNKLNGIGLGDDLIFSAYDSVNGYQLWKSNGLNNGTSIIYPNNKSNFYFTNNTSFYKLNDKIYFSGIDQNFYSKIWVTDGTSLGTEALETKIPAVRDYYLYGLSSESKYLVLTKNEKENCITDGTMLGTYNLKGLDLILNNSAFSLNVIDYNDDLVMNGKSEKYGLELFKFNKVQGFTLLEDLNHKGSNNIGISETINNKLIFSGKDYITNFGLFETDGTEEGTKLVKKLDPISLHYSDTNFFFKNKNKIFFRCLANMTAYDYELCVTDGTNDGTKLVKDLNIRDALPEDPYFMRLNDEEILFIGSENKQYSGAYSLYRTDGTPENTFKIKDILPTRNIFYAGGSNPNVIIKKDYYSKLNNQIYFTVYNNYTTEIWKTDGTETGTLHFFTPPKNTVGNNRTVILNSLGNKFFFKSLDEIGLYNFQDILWVSDGVNNKILNKYKKNENSGGGNYGGINVDTEVFNDKLFYSAYNNDPTNNDFKSTIYFSDGTVEGTKKLKSSIDADYVEFKKCLNKLYFITRGYSSNGDKIWITDGTENGTKLLNQNFIDSGDLINGARSLTCISDNLLFINGYNDNKIWVTNGTIDGTRKLDVSYNGFILNNNDRVFGLYNVDNKLIINIGGYYKPFAENGSELYSTDFDSKILNSIDLNKEFSEKRSNFILYPNPSEDFILIKNIYNQKLDRVEIFDISGNIIKTYNKINEKLIQIPIKFLLNGVYFVKIYFGEFIEIKKIIKK